MEGKVIKLNDNYYKELRKYNHRLLNKNFCNKYNFSLFMYDIEFRFVCNRVGNDNIVIYDILINNDFSKNVICRDLDNDSLFNIYIPVLDKFYVNEKIYVWKNVYVWKKDTRLRKVYSDYNLVNHHTNSYYKIGDVNSYNEILIKISVEQVFDREVSVFKYVGLSFI